MADSNRSTSQCSFYFDGLEEPTLRCIQCKLVLTVDRFRSRPERGPDARFTRCRDCCNAERRAKRTSSDPEIKEKATIADKRWRKRNARRIAVIQNEKRLVARLERNKDKPIIPLGMKQCAKCKEILPLACFWKQRKGSEKPAPRCITCARADQTKSGIAGVYSGSYVQRAIIKQWHVDNPNPTEQELSAWQAENAERVKAERKRKFAEKIALDPEYGARSAKEFRARHPERSREFTREYAKANPHVGAASGHRYRARKLHATPLWAEEALMLPFYVLAQKMTRKTGIEHAVDHIVPLQGRTVCGLHVHTNLQVIPGVENSRKGNRHWPDMWP